MFPILNQPAVFKNGIATRTLSSLVRAKNSKMIFVSGGHSVVPKHRSSVPALERTRFQASSEEERKTNEMAYSLSLACSMDQHSRLFASTWLPQMDSIMQSQLLLSKDQLKYVGTTGGIKAARNGFWNQ